MSIDDIQNPESLRRLAIVMCDAVGVLQQIVAGLEGPIPDHLLEELERLADEAERIKNPN